MSGMLTGGLATPTLLDFGFSGIAAPVPWQPPVGITLSIGPDGTLTGESVFSLHVGDTFGIGLVGTPFMQAATLAASLIITSPTGVQTTIPGIVVLDGSTSVGYDVTFAILTSLSSTWTSQTGYWSYTIVLYGQSPSQVEVVRSRFLVTAA